MIKPLVRRKQEIRLQVARFALDSNVLPLVTETLVVAEAARRAIMSIHGRFTEQNGVRGRSSVFSGKNEGGTPLVGHRHAYYLPTDEDGDGRLDHLTVFAQEGFDSAERRALDEFRRLNTGRRNEEEHPLRLLLLGMGKIDEVTGGPLQKSKVWVSATPYIATRHAKRRGRNAIDVASPEARAEFLISDIRAQVATIQSDIASNGESDVQIECEWDRAHVFRTAGGRRPIEFQRCRRKPGDDGGQRLAGAFRMTFDIALSGPVVLGWSSHFGMGLFVPVAGD
jgi:CRISPR-associated protein Csb2